LAQQNFLVGDIAGNAQRIVELSRQAQQQGADLIVFSELALTGYPPEDLLLRPSLQTRVEQGLQQIAAASQDIAIVLGFPWRENGQLFNCAGFWHGGECLGRYAKQCLPSYQVFDEHRYFSVGDQPCVIDWRGHKLARTVCEDIWHKQPVAQAAAAGAELILNLNASPFHQGKHSERVNLLAGHARRHNLSLLYVNQVGGQDELVFDGASFAVSASGERVVQMPAYEECVALVCGGSDDVEKNRFPGVLLGLSGGIDSALTLAIAVDALGPERVKAIMMPFAYTSDMSKEDAAQQAQVMGVEYRSISIEPMYSAFMQQLAGEFAGLPADTTEQNLQARCRGVLLMALSNKTGSMVLTTSNKSESAVGYSTLYGDMAGGYCALKDVYKMQVFALAQYRNRISPVIPARVLERPPSAELAPD